MTAEKREELLGLLPFSTKATLEYIPGPYLMKKGDTGQEEYVVPENMRPVFSIRAMTRGEMDDLKRKSKGQQMDDDKLREVVASVVVGWKDLYDIAPEIPEEIPYKQDPKGGADRETFRLVPAPVVADLAMCILRMNGLMGTEAMGLRS